MYNKKESDVIYQHKDHELVILKSSWNSKVEALQWWSTQNRSGPFPNWHGAAAFFLSALPIVLRKNLIHHCLYTFTTFTRTTLGILFQSIKSHSNQILCSTHEQFDFRISISYFLFFFFSSFLFFLPFPFLFSLQIFTITSSSNPTSKTDFE